MKIESRFDQIIGTLQDLELQLASVHTHAHLLILHTDKALMSVNDAILEVRKLKALEVAFRAKEKELIDALTQSNKDKDDAIAAAGVAAQGLRDQIAALQKSIDDGTSVDTTQLMSELTDIEKDLTDDTPDPVPTPVPDPTPPGETPVPADGGDGTGTKIITDAP